MNSLWYIPPEIARQQVRDAEASVSRAFESARKSVSEIMGCEYDCVLGDRRRGRLGRPYLKEVKGRQGRVRVA